MVPALANRHIQFQQLFVHKAIELLHEKGDELARKSDASWTGSERPLPAPCIDHPGSGGVGLVECLFLPWVQGVFAPAANVRFPPLVKASARRLGRRRYRSFNTIINSVKRSGGRICGQLGSGGDFRFAV
jgi:hypothetical protein